MVGPSPFPKMTFSSNQSAKYYVQTEEVGDWVESYTVWGSDGSRSSCETLDEVNKVTGGEWAWLSLDDALVHFTRQDGGTVAVKAEFWDHGSSTHRKTKVLLDSSAPWYRPLAIA